MIRYDGTRSGRTEDGMENVGLNDLKRAFRVVGRGLRAHQVEFAILHDKR